MPRAVPGASKVVLLCEIKSLLDVVIVQSDLASGTWPSSGIHRNSSFGKEPKPILRVGTWESGNGKCLFSDVKQVQARRFIFKILNLAVLVKAIPMIGIGLVVGNVGISGAAGASCRSRMIAAVAWVLESANVASTVKA